MSSAPLLSRSASNRRAPRPLASLVPAGHVAQRRLTPAAAVERRAPMIARAVERHQIQHAIGVDVAKGNGMPPLQRCGAAHALKLPGLEVGEHVQPHRARPRTRHRDRRRRRDRPTRTRDSADSARQTVRFAATCRRRCFSARRAPRCGHRRRYRGRRPFRCRPPRRRWRRAIESAETRSRAVSSVKLPSADWRTEPHAASAGHRQVHPEVVIPVERNETIRRYAPLAEDVPRNLALPGKRHRRTRGIDAGEPAVHRTRRWPDVARRPRKTPSASSNAPRAHHPRARR